MKKLAEDAAGITGWCTNVGNERGEALISVMTATEGAGLEKTAQGLVKRYETISIFKGIHTAEKVVPKC